MKSRNWRWAVVVVAAGALLSACRPVQAPPQAAEAGAAEPAAASVEIPVVTLKVTEAGLDAPGEIPSGVVAVTVEGGDPENMPELARLNDGVTMEQLNEALAQPDPMAALPLVALLGSTSDSVDGRVIYDLQPGAYVAVLFMPDGPPQVVPVTAGAPSGAAAPAAAVAVSLVDFNFAMPDKIAAGPQMWQIDNAGGQWHEMAQDEVHMMQQKRANSVSKSLGDLAVDGLLLGVAAGAIMSVFLLGMGMMAGVTPAAVLARFGLPGNATAVTGLLGHLAVSAVLGLVWGVLYGSIRRRVPLPAWLLGAGYGLVLYAGAVLFVVSATGLADFAPWELLAAHLAYGVTLGLLSGRAEGT